MATTSPVLLFTDIIAGPKTGGESNNGAYVTIFGVNFGSSSGAVTVGGGSVIVKSWSQGGSYTGLDKVVIQLGSSAATGNIVLTDSLGNIAANTLAFTVQAGNLYFVDSASTNNPGAGTFADPWRSPASAFSTMTSGGITYLKGSFSGVYGTSGWGSPNFSCGGSQSGTSYIGWPGFTCAFTATSNANFLLYDGSSTWPSGMSIANLDLTGPASTINGGGIIPAAHNNGGTNMRVINCKHLATSVAATGIISPSADNWAFYGNDIYNSGVDPNDLFHGMYVQNGACNVDIGWNTFRGLKLHYACQYHDDVLFDYTGEKFHDNLIVCTNGTDFRGFSNGYMSNASNGQVYNNLFIGVGASFGAVTIYNGTWDVYDNLFYKINAGASGVIAPCGTASLLNSGTAPTVHARNNIVIPYDTGTPYYTLNYSMPSGNLTLANNCYFGNGGVPAADATGINVDPAFVSAALSMVSNFHPTDTSVLTGGTSAVSSVVTRDHDGVSLPFNTHYPIGPYAKAS